MATRNTEAATTMITSSDPSITTAHIIEALEAAERMAPARMAFAIRKARAGELCFASGPGFCGMCGLRSRINRKLVPARYTINNSTVPGHRLWLCTVHTGLRLSNSLY